MKLLKQAKCITGDEVNTVNEDRNNQFDKMFGNATSYITEVNFCF